MPPATAFRPEYRDRRRRAEPGRRVPGQRQTEARHRRQEQHAPKSGRAAAGHPAPQVHAAFASCALAGVTQPDDPPVVPGAGPFAGIGGAQAPDDAAVAAWPPPDGVAGRRASSTELGRPLVVIPWSRWDPRIAERVCAPATPRPNTA